MQRSPDAHPPTVDGSTGSGTKGRTDAPRDSDGAPPNDDGTGSGSARPAGAIRYGKFLLVGFTGVFVNLAAFVVTVDELSGTPLSTFYSSILHFASKTAANPELYLVGSIVAFGVATLWNFALNSVWTFRTRGGRKHSGPRRLGLYFAVSLGSLAVNEVILLLTETVLPPLIGQGLGIIAGSVVGFVGNSRYTFAESSVA